MDKRLSSIISFIFAATLYIAFTVWLLLPYTDKITGIQKLFFVLPAISASGVFILSARYANSFFARLVAGLLYGFGSFACSFYCFHPFAHLVYAFLPFSFIPAVFLYKHITASENITGFLSALFSLVPFLFVIACFFIAARFFLFPIPSGIWVSLTNLTGLLTPENTPPDGFAIGFYHVPLGAIAVGMILFFKTRRYWIAILSALAIFLSLYHPILNVPPIFWLSFIILFGSITAAAGLDAMALTGRADANWLLLSAAVLLLQAAVAAVLNRTLGFPIPAGLSAIGIIAILLVFFIARAGFALHFVRKVVLYAAVLLDIAIVTKSVIDLIF